MNWCVNTNGVFPPPSDVYTLNSRRPIVSMFAHYFPAPGVLFLGSYVRSFIFNCFSYLRIFPTRGINRCPCLLSWAVRFSCFAALRPIVQIWIKLHEYSCGAQAELRYVRNGKCTNISPLSSEGILFNVFGVGSVGLGQRRTMDAAESSGGVGRVLSWIFKLEINRYD